MRYFITASVVALLSAVPAHAQCFGDDGFSIPGACCAPVTTVNLPPFPAWFMNGDGACFTNCSLQSQFPVAMNLGAPIQIFDDLYVTFLTLGGSITTPSNLVIMKYARTWLEAGPTGVVHQVWRFLVNTEITYSPPSPAPCPVPVCATTGMTVHFVGSIDYSNDCNASGPTWSVAMNLTHLCGDMAHGPFSSKPTSTANHPGRLYALVGPTPFNFNATVALPGGLMTGDSVRSTLVNLSSGTWQTHSEVPVFAGQSPLVTNDCACSVITTPPPRWERRLLRFDYDCLAPPLNSFNAIPWAPIAPTGFNVFPLGTYANPFAYPGNESVSVGFGVSSAPDVCGLNLPIHVLHAVATLGGFLSFHFNSALPPSFDFIDVENQYVINFAGPSMSIGYGAFFLSTMVWSGNW